MTLPAFPERPATRADHDAVTEPYRSYDAQVRGAVDTEPSDVERDRDEPGFDLATSTLVLELDEKGGMRVVEQFTRWERPASD